MTSNIQRAALIIRGALGATLFYARQYGEAIELYRETIAADPGFLSGRTDLARALELANSIRSIKVYATKPD